MNDTMRSLSALSTSEVAELLTIHLELAEQRTHELATRARQRCIPTHGRFTQGANELPVLLEVSGRTIQRYCDRAWLPYIVSAGRRRIERVAVGAREARAWSHGRTNSE